MANPTTNYGFVLPTPTNLVTDLPADFDVALQGVDTRLKALQPGTTLGDLAYSSATANTNTRLPIGTSGQVLAVSGGGVPAWTTTADVTPLTTKGDLFTFTTVDARLGVGTNGQTLVADSAEATGLKWATPTSGGGLTVIATGTLSGTSVVISSIPGTYKQLLVNVYGATWDTANDSLGLRYNSVVTNYNNSTYGHNNTTAANNGSTTNTSWVNNDAAFDWLRTGGENQATWLIYNYTSTTGSVLCTGNVTYVASNSGKSRATNVFGNTATPAAITSLTIRFDGGRNMTAGTYTVYGVS